MIGIKLILAGVGILVVACISIAVVRFKRLRTILGKEIIDYSILKDENKQNN